MLLSILLVVIRNPSSRARSARRILFCPYGERSEPIKRMGVLLFSLLAGCWGLSTAVTKPAMISIQKFTWIIFLALLKKPFFCFWVNFFFKKKKERKNMQIWAFLAIFCCLSRPEAAFFYISARKFMHGFLPSSYRPVFFGFSKKKIFNFFFEKWL